MDHQQQDGSRARLARVELADGHVVNVSPATALGISTMCQPELDTATGTIYDAAPRKD